MAEDNPDEVSCKPPTKLKNPAAATILDKFCEGTSKNPQMKLVGGMTLRKLASLPQSAYLQPHLEEFDKELQAIKCV